MENKKLTLGIGEPIDSSKMYLVRVQDNFDNAASKDGAVILTHLGEYRNSFHFAQNSIVSNHFYGKFDGECAIISPMMETFSNGQTPSGFSQADTWIAGDSNKSITVPSATLVVPEGAKVPPGVDVVHYQRGATVDETIAARDKAIAEVFAAKQAPLFKVGMDSWANERHVSQSENEAAIKELFGEEIAANIATDRHSNTNDYAIEQLIASRNDLEKRMAAGEVWRLSQSGVDVPLSYTLGKVNENLGETLEKAMGSAASVNAANYYAAKFAEHRAAPLAEAAPLQAASMEMPPPLPGAAVPPPLPGAVAEVAPLQAASLEMPPPLPGAAVPPPLPGAVAEAAPLQAASMEMPPPLPGAAVPPPLRGAVAEAAPLQNASMEMPPSIPSPAEVETTPVEREPNSVGYWRRNTIDALTMQLTGYFPELSDPDQMEKWGSLHKELEEAKAAQAEVEKRYDRIYGKYLAVGEASSDPTPQATALTSQQHGDDVPTWMNDIPPLEDFYEMTGADIEHGQAMTPPTVAPEQTLEVPAVPVAAEQGLEIAEHARQERLDRAALEQVAQTRASENAAVREELGMNRIEPMTLAKKGLSSEASRWANRAPSADADVNSKVAQQEAGRERAIPAEVEKTYIRVGEKFYHGNNHEVVAFEDKGTQLSTKSDSQAIASSLVAIAQARGWQEIKISGSEAFRKQVWMEASLLGIEAKGYKPTAVEIADLQKRLPENKIEEFRVREKDRMAEAALPAAVSPPKDAAAAKVDAKPAQRTYKEELSAAALQSNHKETQVLSSHGVAPYKHNPDEKESYYVETENKSGQKKTHWGKDLKRAISESGAKIGDEIDVARVGAKDVVVLANIKDGSGKKVGEKTIETIKNEWAVSVTQALKTQDIGDAVKQHPELSGSAAVLKAIELQTANNTPEQKKIIMDRVKENLSNSIERGNIPQVKIRENVSEIKPTKQQAGKEQQVELQKELEL